MVSELDFEDGFINIYMENYAPIYGIQFAISVDGIEDADPNQLAFGDGQGGRAEEYGWTVSTNDSGLVIGVAQFTGNPIPGGEGILTQIPINISSFEQSTGQINISDLQVSGYFGSEITYEIGSPLNYESGLNLDDNVFIPKEHKLFSAYPNPFNPIVNIPFELATQAHVVLNIYDLKGKKVETLMDKLLSKGGYEINWNASSNSSGVYVCALESDDWISTSKLILIK